MSLMTRELKASYAFVERNFNLIQALLGLGSRLVRLLRGRRARRAR